MEPFHAMAELKENSAGKDVNVTNKNTKTGPPNLQLGQPLNSSFLKLSKRSLFGKHVQFWQCFTPLLTLFLHSHSLHLHF